ncbi:hypothetical protein KKB10_02920 [Patescibacteria group bacterium]|nr:hypothetical protein [Patescibacteria group bacterium]MBU1075266.1 hypothetical protein [Patescibacteria group bacterium]MBU1952166.1 hypothetical protein [Patescibacteria group bacterium]MBU2229036.1 hypothetical protein [Patescibacteria group bacterium]MBU2236220.1 hypothetical protein [Patescibacteria group bacterium]
MKKSLYTIGVLLVVGIFAYYAATTLSKNDQDNDNANTNSVVNSEWKTYSHDSGLSFDYPENATVWPDGYKEESGSLSIIKNSDYIDDYMEEYVLFKNGIPGITLSEYISQNSAPEYKDSKKEIDLNGMTAYQYVVKNPTDIYLGTFFEDNNSNYYDFYIEQGAPSLEGKITGELSQEYLNQIESTYTQILNSIKFVN